jgi:hypothetical protein
VYLVTDADRIIEQREKDLREIAIVIDTWDDIFSDFDPRPLNERMVSGDFVTELRKRYKETRLGNFLITIYASPSLKNTDSERIVNKRLKQHFRQKFLRKKKTLNHIRIRGTIFVIVGICSLSFLTLATYYKFLHALTIQLLEIILMPLGWFGLWEGFSKLIDTSPVLIEDEALYEKLSKAKYDFKYISDEKENEGGNPPSGTGQQQ